MLEVEQKFPVEDFEPVRRRLEELHAQWASPLAQCDTYFAHPSRDFAQTDEALRLRHTKEALVLTYKGPRAGGLFKTQREIEVAFPPQDADAENLAQLLTALGFRRFADVRKQRCEVLVQHAGREMHVALDEVEQVGSFVEIEVLAEDNAAEDAGQALASLAEVLCLHDVEKRSYLEIWLTRQGLSEPPDNGSGGRKGRTS